MKLRLTAKIIGPFALLALLGGVMWAVVLALQTSQDAKTGEERALLQAAGRMREVADHVKGGILTRNDAYAIEAAKAALDVDLKLSGLGPEGEALRTQFADYFAAAVAINSIYLENRIAEGEKRLDQLKDKGQKLDAAIRQRMDAVEAGRLRLQRMGLVLQLGVALAMGGALLLVALFISRSVVRPVTELRDLIRCIAQGEGDLTARVAARSGDEIGEIADAFNQMMVKLQQVMRVVTQTARDVAQASEGLAGATTQTAQASQRQAESAAATAATVEQVTVSIAQVADHTKEAEHLAASADALAQEGRATAERAAQQIMETAAVVSQSAVHITALSERSEQIRSIVGVIRGIADQTNLLALNAAIEAARAGEQGRGFAVVADEVRKLAERTRTATAEIAGMIDAMGSEVGKTVEMIQESSRQEEGEMAAAQTLRTMLDRISESVDRSAERIREIAAATREQSQAAEQVAHNVENIAQMSEEIRASTGMSSESAEKLRTLAAGLHDQVGRFRV